MRRRRFKASVMEAPGIDPATSPKRTIGRFEEQDKLHQDDLKKRINSSYSSKSS